MLSYIKSNFSEVKQPGLSAIFRSIIFWALFLFLLFIGIMFIAKLFPASWERFVYGITGTIAALIATWILLKIDRKKFSEIGLAWQNKPFLNFFKGIAIGSFVFGVLLSALLLFTELRIEKNNAGIGLLNAAAYLAIIPLAFMEELAFRAYPFLKINKVFGLRITQLIVAVAFALYHIVIGWGVVIAFLGPGIWAFVFGLSAKWSNGIAMPTGIHVAVNVLQPLVGMSAGTYTSIWILKYKEGTSAEQISKTDLVGIILQVFLLISAILLTEYFIRKKSKNLKQFS